METNVLLEQKRDALMKAVNRQEGAYVPNIITSNGGTIAWTGKRTVDVIENPHAYIEALNAVYDVMWMDGLVINTSLFTPKRERAFEKTEYKFGPDGNTPEHLQLALMKADEYPQLIADPDRFVKEVLLPRKLPQFYADKNKARNALKLYAEDKFYSLVQTSGMCAKDLAEKHGIVQVSNLQKIFETPIDILFDCFRGFRGTLTDLRRQPDNVRAALDKLWEVRCLPTLGKLGEGDFPYAVQFPHIPAYLSPKQFEELYWPHEKKLIETIAASGGKAFVFLEGRWEKIWHHFLELPKDSCILAPDDDDIFKLHKELGHHQIIMGGVKLVDTRTKTLDQLKDNVMREIDAFAPGGGFLFGCDKCWIAPGDVNQTTIDVFNFAHEYSSKK